MSGYRTKVRREGGIGSGAVVFKASSIGGDARRVRGLWECSTQMLTQTQCCAIVKFIMYPGKRKRTQTLRVAGPPAEIEIGTLAQ